MNDVLLREKLTEFLIEDIGTKDVSTETIFSEFERGTAVFRAKEAGILSGIKIVKTVYAILDPSIEVLTYKSDGDYLEASDKIAIVNGSIKYILQGERVILNLVQRMSGIATLTKQAINKLNSNHTRICDTRKTTPGLRVFEKYAITCGGGFNHRHGLFDGVMIKDNHIAFCGSITEAVEHVRKQLGPMVKIEVETETEAQVREAVQANCDIIMFDNSTPEEITALKRLVPKHIITEASGGITMEHLQAYKHTGVDYISLGFLTHSVRSLDISLSIEEGI